MSPTRAISALAALALLAFPAGSAAGGTRAAPAEPDYSITLHPSAPGPAIADSMYGVFFEDINYAADGGLYAELVRNRSFEFLPVDNASYTGLTAWTPGGEAGGTGTATTVDDTSRLNDRNRTYLRLDLTSPGGGRYGVTNSGYNTGIALRAGTPYDFSVWARSDAPGGTTVSVVLRDAAGEPLAKPVEIVVRGDSWARYPATLRATRTTDAGRLAVLGGGTGTLRLDMISLFPRDTYQGRPNGLRRDLAEKIAALKPGFVRFPGGCLVNTGSHYANDRVRGPTSGRTPSGRSRHVW